MSLPYGGAPNGAGGGPTNFTTQNPPAGTITGKLIDGGTTAYTGFNTTATDTLNAAIPKQPRDPKAGPVPPSPAPDPGSDVAGQHSIAYSGNGLTQQIFKYPTAANLTYSSQGLPGQLTQLNYGAIVFYATPPTGAASLSIELVGGSGATQYDVRIACTGAAAGASYVGVTTRYVCPLPAYGSTNTQFFANPVLASGTPGAFTPTAATLYVVVNDAAPLATTGSGTLVLDYLFAEQGTT